MTNIATQNIFSIELSELSKDFTRHAPSHHTLIHAENDVAAVLTWLREYHDSPHTLNSYRKESERLLMWLSDRHKTLAQLSRNDLMDYQQFLADPQPAERWIGPRIARRSPRWRPFSSPLRPSSVRQAMVIIGGLLNYLTQAGYLRANPMALSRRKLKNAPDYEPIERYLEHDAWQFVLDTLQRLPTHSTRALAHRERTLWIFSLFYLTGARLSEVRTAVMGDIRIKRGLWWWKVVGKGQKVGEIPIGDDLLAALQRYRVHLGLTPLPSINETTPLVTRLSSRGRYTPMTDKAIYLIIKRAFMFAADRAEQKNTPEYKELAQKLRAASTHWLRHTSASHQLEAGIPLLVVSQNLRHSNIQTTRRYLHTDEEDRHAATQQLRLLPRATNPQDK